VRRDKFAMKGILTTQTKFRRRLLSTMAWDVIKRRLSATVLAQAECPMHASSRCRLPIAPLPAIGAIPRVTELAHLRLLAA